ncbi:MAG: hypothetical protein ABL898_10270 [Hyphomicrobiaceae bacterium]|nr:hypothetical protein [Hyphomicrobiaceae bacterium]
MIWRTGLLFLGCVYAFAGPAHSATPTVSSTSPTPMVGTTTTIAPLSKPGTKAAQRKAPVPKFDRPEVVLQFIQGYRARPEPQHLASVFSAMTRHGVFREMEQAGIHLGFLGGVLSTLDDDRAAATLVKMFPVHPEDQPALIKAVAFSGHPQWKALLRGITERMPSRAVLVDRYLTDKMPALEAMALDAGPQPLDVLWGNYFATGSFEPIVRIISVLKWSADGNDVERLTIGSMAKWTLAQNASRDVDLLRLLKAALTTETPEGRKRLVDVIEAAETAETGKIRKEALVAIEQLKVKGPAKTRNAQWWGQAGQTALAFGCVVGSALGNVAIGVPCVIGGALSGVALKAIGN